jgi:hypothetical protein
LYAAWYKKAVELRDKAVDQWKELLKTHQPQELWGPKVKRKDRCNVLKTAGASETWGELKAIFLHDVFHYKCAYCEGKFGAGFPWQVEHYRPKSEVTEQRRILEHPGYFWLAYEWHNLLLCCGECNTWEEKTPKNRSKSHPAKSNEFRIRGPRVQSPDPDPARWLDQLRDEKPLLLNPYFLDDPAKHFGFLETGYIYGKTEEGRETLEVCNLNRIELIERRTKQSENVKTRLIARLYDAGQAPGEPYYGVADEFSAWMNYYVNVEIRRIHPPRRSTTSATPIPNRTPKTNLGYVQAARHILRNHPDGLKTDQIASHFNGLRDIRVADLLDTLLLGRWARKNPDGSYVTMEAPA